MRHSKFPKGCIEDTVDIYESFYSIPEKYIYPSFLLFSDPALGRCYRCMVIYEKHFNVLQYKESKLRLFGHLGQVNRCVHHLCQHNCKCFDDVHGMDIM